MPISDLPGTVSLPSRDLLSPSPDRLQQRLKAAEGGDSSSRRGEVVTAAREFESLFVSYLLKVMRDTIEESGLLGEGLGRDIYTDLFDQELSRKISQHGALGIADMLTRYLSDNPAGGDRPRGTPTAAPGVGEDSSGSVPDVQLPVQAPISSGYGTRRHPISREIHFHKGIDIAAPEGTEVRAAWGGRVVFSGYQPGYGRTVVLEHPEGFQTRYAHLSASNVKAGDSLGPEAVLGAVGSSGRSTGPHLHFEVTRSGKHLDPLTALGPTGGPVAKPSIFGEEGT